MTLSRTGEAGQALAIQTRNVAGLVTKRRTNTSGAMTFVESNWTYDKLGRVVDQVVQKGPGPTQVARQTLTYFGNDDPSSLTHSLGTSSRRLNFGFDLRHQLTSVTSPTAGYFAGTYQYGTAGRFTRATEAQTISPLPTGSEVKPRDVNYVYGGTDPEQVTSLTNVSGGATYASYVYDLAGNQTRRTYPPTNESWDYIYDGKDQLRRATKKLNNVVQGSEEYWYDGEGKRLAIVKRDAAGTKSELIWFIGDTQAHHNAAGAVTHVYSHLSLGTPAARVDRTSNTTTSLEYQFHGIASNTLAAVAHNGTINASFSYTPFGSVIESTNAGGTSTGVAAHRRRLNDKYEDELTALSYYGARYYDKRLLGWTQADPLYRFEPEGAWDEPRRARLYSFSENNPLRFLDPDGLESIKSTVLRPLKFDPQKGVSLGEPDLAQAIASLVVSAAANTNPVTRALDTVASYDPDATVEQKLDMRGIANGGSNGTSVPTRVHGNSKSSNKTQHAYDIERMPGGNDAAGKVKNGVSGTPLQPNGTSDRANRQVSKLNRTEKGKNEYRAIVTKKNVNATKTKTARERILDYERKRSKKHAEGGEPMDKHKRPLPDDTDKDKQ